MRVAVAGGTGLTGGYVVESLRKAGHEPVVLARSTGSDLLQGTGLDDLLAGVDAVVDVTSTTETDAAETRAFFETVTTNLLDAEARAGVRHHVVLSIVGVDRVEGSGHYVGKRRQEEVVEAGSIPYTIQRATPFYEFADLVLGWMTKDGAATMAPLLLQPIAVADVGQRLAEIAVGLPQGRATDIAGPETQDFVDMSRRILSARGSDLRLIASWQNGPFGVEMAGEVMLPGDDAVLAPTTFDEWLAAQPRTGG